VPDRLAVMPQYLMPKRLITQLAGKFANLRGGALTHATIRRFVAKYGVNMAEAADPRIESYPTFNEFFTRPLRAGLRPIADADFVCPVDAAISQFGPIEHDQIFQAKGHSYSTRALVGGDQQLAHQFDHGHFATLYLAPKDYHRIHIPIDGDIVAATYIPGELWPVNVHAVAHVADLFAVNERIVVTIRGRAGGTMAVVLVGATMVGTTRVAFDDLHTNAQRRIVQRRGYQPSIPVRAGDLLGHFEFGSTVIVVCSRYAGAIDPLAEGETVRMGQRLGRRGASSSREA
jgi:phosphatidylserine decarboxylase